jgi:hypothetical protein
MGSRLGLKLSSPISSLSPSAQSCWCSNNRPGRPRAFQRHLGQMSGEMYDGPARPREHAATDVAQT